MNALRIILTQSKAHYRKEESLTNKMTYPLPPFATVIGALHNSSGFKKYHQMDISVQGKYRSLIKQPYTDYCFLDSTMDDRGILVKLKNQNLLSKGFEKVATALKSQGNSFKEGKSILTHDKKLLEEYRKLKILNKKISEFKKNRLERFKELTKKRKEALRNEKSFLNTDSEEYKAVVKREKEINAKEKLIKNKMKEFEYQNFSKPYSLFKSLTTSLKFYEILHEVELVVHIKSDEEILQIISDNIDNLKSIGRSEDFVNVQECKLINLDNKIAGEGITSDLSSYLNYDLVKKESIFFGTKYREGIPANGTKYYLNKNYEIENSQRVFNKKKVLFASGYTVDDESTGVYFDGEYIVNFN